jgi:ketosteroid isomerase-like protein
MKADPKVASEVASVIDRMANAYASRDLTAVMACFAEDEDAVLYGTAPDEKRVGPKEIRAQVERDWAQSDQVELVFESKSISAAGTVAWAALDGSFEVRARGDAISIPARVTFVLEKRGDTWSIVHAHFSTPAASQEDGNSF